MDPVLVVSMLVTMGLCIYGADKYKQIARLIRENEKRKKSSKSDITCQHCNANMDCYEEDGTYCDNCGEYSIG